MAHTENSPPASFLKMALRKPLASEHLAGACRQASGSAPFSVTRTLELPAFAGIHGAASCPRLHRVVQARRPCVVTYFPRVVGRRQSKSSAFWRRTGHALIAPPDYRTCPLRRQRGLLVVRSTPLALAW